MKDLTTRILEGEGADRELEMELHVLAGSAPTHNRMAPPYTSSVDAALAFAERMLPEQWAALLHAAMSDMFGFEAMDTQVLTPSSKAELAQLPRAILAATLKAKEEG